MLSKWLKLELKLSKGMSTSEARPVLANIIYTHINKRVKSILKVILKANHAEYPRARARARALFSAGFHVHLITNAISC